MADQDVKLADLFERLVDEGGDLLQAEVRIAEAKIARRLQLARLPLGLFSASAALAFVALMGLATAFVVLLGPLVGFLLAVVIVTLATAAASWLLFVEARKRLEVVIEAPSLLLRSRSEK
ncbi:phage holin family protein [Sphingosinicella soli]|uniref:Putative oligopeptide transporter (OPT) family protein n=1 Tax=Sphingosinicella soli TaxID=333708 RepID=A0A7W7AY58_9SPHN|nr:phage holin family protein [Sphingosinicella soli]MBB4630519.1 putative oligopeptide transporter (OPT) family protein [Sphingosinicella soli]